MKKLISLLLALVMIFTLVACNTTEPEKTNPVDTKPQAGNNDDTKATDPAPAEPVKITLFPLNANSMSGEVGGWIGEYLASQGIILEIMAYSEDKLNAILAGEDLPDIMYLPAGTDFLSLAESGMFMDMEQYLDKLPSLTSNDMYKTAIQYTKEYVTDGTLTMLPQNVGPVGPSTTNGTVVKLNWEIYKQIGCPEVKTLDDLISVLKKMQEAYPKTPEGVTTYCQVAFNSMDNTYLYNINDVFSMIGHTADELQYGIEVNHETKEFNYMFADDSAYKYALGWMNTMYREGLLDPDSVSSDRDTQYNKIEVSKNVLAAYCGAPGYESYGFYPVYVGDMLLATNDAGWPYGGGSYAAVSAKTENLETVLKFLNLAGDPTAVRILSNGPQGELWDRDENGKLVITDKGIAAYINGEDVTIGDEKYVFFNTPWLIHPNTLDPIDGECVNVANSKTFVLMSSNTDGQKEWAENYGYSDFITMLEDKGQKVARFHQNASKYAETADDSQNMIVAAAKDIIVTESWKMIYAKTDAEFEQLWNDLVEEVEELGMKDIYNWRVKALNDGLAIRDSLAG